MSNLIEAMTKITELSSQSDAIIASSLEKVEEQSLKINSIVDNSKSLKAVITELESNQ